MMSSSLLLGASRLPADIVRDSRPTNVCMPVVNRSNAPLPHQHVQMIHEREKVTLLNNGGDVLRGRNVEVSHTLPAHRVSPHNDIAGCVSPHNDIAGCLRSNIRDQPLRKLAGTMGLQPTLEAQFLKIKPEFCPFSSTRFSICINCNPFKSPHTALTRTHKRLREGKQPNSTEKGLMRDVGSGGECDASERSAHAAGAARKPRFVGNLYTSLVCRPQVHDTKCVRIMTSSRMLTSK